MPELRTFNLPRVRRAAEETRARAMRNKMATAEFKEYQEGREAKKKYRNIMAEYTSPPGTKEVALPKGTVGPRERVPTPGKLDRPGAAAALYGAGMPGKAAEFEESSLEMKRKEAQIDASLATKSAAERKSIIELMNYTATRMGRVATKYDKHIANGRTPKQAQELVDAAYERAAEEVSAAGGDISGWGPAFDRSRFDEMTTLKERTEQKYKVAQIGKLEAETKKIKRETGKGKLTGAQKSNNAEIDNSRRILRERGIQKADIKRLTSKSTETGRENPDYDPDIARVVGKALQRKVGDDPEFEIVSNIYQLGRPGEPAPELAGAVGQLKSKNIVKRGTFKGRKVIQYEDGSVEYAD